jgi:transmembrane protein TMEM260 (protein O-mannosyltransferase)
MRFRTTPSRAIRVWLFFLVTAAAAAVFWRTAYPTIAWWDSSQYSLAAATLGITSSPGSLLLTLLGWLVTRLPSTLAPAHRLNLFAGALAAMTVGLVYATAMLVARSAGDDHRGDRRDDRGAARGMAIGAALGALGVAFGSTLWEYAVMFTPYVLTAVFTGLLLWTMMRWWAAADRDDAWRWLAWLGLLFGLDFSVHRSNALLIPAVLAWILVRRPQTIARPASWLAGAGGLVAGLAVQLLVIPIARHTRSPLVMLDPTTWSRFWDYVSLAQVGGGFLVDLWPRKAALWSVQVADLLRVVGESYFHALSPVRVLGWLPGVAATIGLVGLWRRDRRLGAAFTLVLLLQATMTVLYFNIPADYFRSLHRHYLPVLVTIGVAAAYGAGVVAQQVARWAKGRRAAGAMAAATVGGAALLALPVVQLAANWRTHDASRRYFTRDYAANALQSLPPRAVYLTVGDTDTFPLWYLQAVERVRPDVRVVNLSLANAPWYVHRLVRRDVSFPLSSPTVIDGMRGPAPHTADTVAIPVRGSAEALGIPAGTPVPVSVTVRPGTRFGDDYLPADVVLLDIVRTNAFRIPLCVATTAGPDGLGWLQPYARLRGLHRCITPLPALGPDRDLLHANLLERYEYRGYADTTAVLDDVSLTMGRLYVSALGELLAAERAAGAADRCRREIAELFAKVPPNRVAFPAEETREIEARCDR